MAAVRQFAKQIPGIAGTYRFLRRRCHAARAQLFSTEQIFTGIYRRKAWGGRQSASGTGSDAEETAVLIRELPVLFRELGVTSVLDLPCGDFHWMRHVDLSGIDYTGADIVDGLVARNRLHETATVRFRQLNLLTDDLPRVDLVFCRDCLVHFSSHDVRRALDNIARSGATWLLTTTFPARAQNQEIATGDWRPLNLQAQPFHLPAPQRLIDERCPAAGGAYADKSLGLWSLGAIR
jgi:SAM-dependent methyltransferase